MELTSRKTATASRPQARMRTVSILGATGSVGSSTVEIVAANPDRFHVEALIGGSNAERLAEQAKATGARVAVVANEACYPALKQALAGSRTQAAAGRQAVLDAASAPVDVVMAAIVGTAGLEPTLAALRAGADVALANKECLVTAGRYFMREASRLGRAVIPVDSEHSAIFQTLAGSDSRQLERIVLTASGGPFRLWTQDRMASATAADALKHPNWSMGAKITIDSATMMNKGLELIEAHYLFDLPHERIDVFVHPESAVHGLAEFSDGSILAQLGAADMRTPVAVALAWPERMAANVRRLDLLAMHTLHFEAPDLGRFPALRIARAALEAGGVFTAVLNAANEVAVEAFLSGRIGFLEIANVVQEVLDWAAGRFSDEAFDLAAIIEIDCAARQYADDRIARFALART